MHLLRVIKKSEGAIPDFIPTSLIFWIVTSVLIGAAIYLASFFLSTGKKFSIENLFASAISLPLLPTGIDLIICAYNPSHLVEKISENGTSVLYTGIIVIGEIHRLDIAVAGVVLAAVGVSGLVISCKK